MEPWAWAGVLSFLLYISAGAADTYRYSRQVSAGTQPGVCRYGHRVDCCYGWKRNGKGQCEAQCDHGCKHGLCVGPNKCRCDRGYTGKTCSQDLNECGLKPRPCEHRCMNTYGSYKCYCLNGYMLMPDGSCANSRTCALAHCQYGCEEVQGEIRCLCPSGGLHLGTDQKTCVDIDECASSENLCPNNRRCINTFGSYFCKCQIGFDLKYVNGKYDCADMDECTSNTHKCSQHAECFNTEGSYKCKCKLGYRGNGFDCTAIPDIHVKQSRGRLDIEQHRNIIPEPVVTVGPKARLQPFDYEGEVYIGIPKEAEGEEDKGEEEDNQENQIEMPDEFESLVGTASDMKEIPILPGQEEFIVDCDFNQGVCEWLQDKDDDFDWGVAYHDSGAGYYMAASGLQGGNGNVARLKLLLGDRTQQDSFCLTFNYRVLGDRVGLLRVLLDNIGYPVWEQSHSEGWQTELITIAWEDEPPHSVIFEAERRSGVGGEIGLDNVVLTSGSCQEDDSVIF